MPGSEAQLYYRVGKGENMARYHTAVISEQGLRPSMEDTYVVVERGKGEWFGGVYDGHGGAWAAEYARDHLHKIFFAGLERGGVPEEAFFHAYEEVDRARAIQASGTTAVNFYCEGDTVYFANVGDSRLIIVRGNEVQQLSEDHRVENPSERARILACGGIIEGPYVMRGGAGLMTTRSLGDEYFKEVGVSAIPYVGRHELTSQDGWLIAGTDGIFDVMDNHEVGDAVRGRGDPVGAAVQLKREVLEVRRATDNVTVLLVPLPLNSSE